MVIMWLFTITTTGVVLAPQLLLLVVRADARAQHNGKEDYPTENTLRMPPMSGHGDLKMSWTDDYHCPPGAFLTAYRTTYSDTRGYLLHLAAACSELTTEFKASNKNHILNVGVSSHHTFSANDLQGFVSSSSATDAYAIGASWSTFDRRKNKKRGVGVTSSGDVELIFQNDWYSSPQKRQVDSPSSYWIEDQIYYGLCTKDFALCGIRAELHHSRYTMGIEGKMTNVVNPFKSSCYSHYQLKKF